MARGVEVSALRKRIGMTSVRRGLCRQSICHQRSSSSIQLADPPQIHRSLQPSPHSRESALRPPRRLLSASRTRAAKAPATISMHDRSVKIRKKPDPRPVRNHSTVFTQSMSCAATLESNTNTNMPRRPYALLGLGVERSNVDRSPNGLSRCEYTSASGTATPLQLMHISLGDKPGHTNQVAIKRIHKP